MQPTLQNLRFSSYTEVYVHLRIHTRHHHIVLHILRHQLLLITPHHHILRSHSADPCTRCTSSYKTTPPHYRVHSRYNRSSTGSYPPSIDLSPHVYQCSVRHRRLKLMNNVLSLTQLRILRVVERDLAHLVANVLQLSHHRCRAFFLHRLHHLVILRCHVVTMAKLRRLADIPSPLALVFLPRTQLSRLRSW